MRLAGLAALLHVRQHVEIELGIVIEHALAGRRVVGEGLGHESRIDQQPAQPLGDLRQRVPPAAAL